MNDSEDIVTVKLPKDMALALFEWSYSFMQEPHTFQLTHPADAIGIDQLASELEWELKEIFQDSYPQKLAEARESVVNRYKTRMNDANVMWLQKLTYRDVEKG